MTRTVQVINASYEPIQFVPIQHAIKMITRGVAVVEEAVEGIMFGPFLMPKVVRLVRMVKTAWQYTREARYSKNGILNRDKHQCAFCGKFNATTVDHIKPRSKGGKSTWMNCISACKPCNNKKADRLLEDCGMKLLFQPFEPKVYFTRGEILFSR